MRKRKSLFATVFTLIMSMAMITAMGINNVSAAELTPGVPTVYFSWSNTEYVQVTPRAPVDSYVFGYIMTWDLPHITHEPTDPTTDVTWAAEVSISWDPTVLELLTTGVIEPPPWSPYAPGNPGAVWKFNYWTFVGYWMITGQYAGSMSKWVDTTAGKAKVGYALMSPGPDESPLGPFWGVMPGCPDESLHDGLYYDLPYTVQGKYSVLAMLMFKVLADADTAIHLHSPLFFAKDMSTLYDVVTLDGGYGAVPEFPVGAAIEIGLIAAIAYIFVRSRRKIKLIKTTYHR